MFLPSRDGRALRVAQRGVHAVSPPPRQRRRLAGGAVDTLCVWRPQEATAMTPHDDESTAGAAFVSSTHSGRRRAAAIQAHEVTGTRGARVDGERRSRVDRTSDDEDAEEP